VTLGHYDFGRKVLGCTTESVSLIDDNFGKTEIDDSSITKVKMKRSIR
jgi:hypothetical protein